MSHSTFVLPMCPALNRLYRRSRNGGMFKIQAAHDFEDTVQLLLAKETPLEGDVSMEITFYFNRLGSDIDGRLKATLDALEGSLYHNDGQISDLTLHKRLDRGNPRIEVTLL